MILKAKQKEKEREEGRKEKGNKEEEYWFGAILLFAGAFHKSKAPFVKSNLTKSQVFNQSLKETKKSWFLATTSLEF